MKLITIILFIVFLAFPQSLKPNQAIAEADRDYPATFFNKALVIEVADINDGKVSGRLKSPDFADALIEKQGVGYEVVYNAFTVRILGVSKTSATFFVEKN